MKLEIGSKGSATRIYCNMDSVVQVIRWVNPDF